MARTVVSNVEVLTAGTRYDQEEAKDGKPQRSTVVTLAVLPHDGERIALAAAEGKISLALRNPLDVEPDATTGIKLAALMRGTGPEPVLDATQAPHGAGRRPCRRRRRRRRAVDLQGRNNSRRQARRRGGAADMRVMHRSFERHAALLLSSAALVVA